MKPFDYVKCLSLDHALGVVSETDVKNRLLAGGTDLLIELRKRNGGEQLRVVDVHRLPGLGDIIQKDGRIRVGALATHTGLVESEIIQRYVPFLATAAASVGSVQIRNRGTVGGNICNASPCVDTVPPLAALDADVTLESVRGKRSVSIKDFFTGPYQTILEGDEILTQVSFPTPSKNARTCFMKLGRRNAVSIARMNIATFIVLDSRDICSDVRIAAGSVMPTTRRLARAEAVVKGQTPSVEIFEEAGRQAAVEMVEVTGRRWSTSYKEPVLAALVRRALMEAVGMDWRSCP